MDESRIIKYRTVLVPLLQGLVWFASITISVFYDFGGGDVTSRLLLFGILCLFFELLFVFIDMLFALNGYSINRDLRFHIQLRNLPFVIFGVPAAIWAFISINWIVIVFLFALLAGLKSGLLQAVVEIDNNKEPLFHILQKD